MIGFVSGEVVAYDNPHVVVSVGGVGYKILVSNTVVSKVSVGEKLKLFTHTHVRDDAIQLFGFLDISDLKLFESLIGVSGVGPRTAMSIFSVGDRTRIVEAIVSNDVVFFSSVPRLGKKNAQKIIIELKSKFGSMGDLDLATGDKKEENKEVILALKSFGFNTKEATEALRSIKEDGKSVEEKVRLALKVLGE